jgi:5,10-methylenetetrahydromethanopterin reductase
MTELWTLRAPSAGRAAAVAERVEAEGWDGLTVTDSQNLAPDPFIALALAATATSRLGLATGVTNPVTRHPAACATAIGTVHQVARGRAVLGIGRGDSALFHLGQEPAPWPVLERFVERLQGYLSGRAVDLDGYPSTLHWLASSVLPKVPVDVAATGPKVIALAARHAERITFAVGADPSRIRLSMSVAADAARAAGRDPAALSFGAYVNVTPHPDVTVARGIARGGAATMAHFSGMTGTAAPGTPPEVAEVVEALHANYDRPRHTRADASHTALLHDDFMDRFAVIGPPEVCVPRLQALLDCGLSRLVITSGSLGADRDEVLRSYHLLIDEVLPALRSGLSH